MITIYAHPGPTVSEQPIEIVERKGIGHPDSMCDAIMEAISLRLCLEYTRSFGVVKHHNLDKGFLVAGVTEPHLGGGKVLEPMRLIFGDRAVYEHQGLEVPVGDIAEATAKAWFKKNLRFVDPEQHMLYQNEIKPGSPELTDIFEREMIGANDTSAAVGYAPLSETERIVLASERYLNGEAFKTRFPESGEDIKVMGYRTGRNLTLTIAMAFVDRYVKSLKHYFERKAEMVADLETFLSHERRDLETVRVQLNTLDGATRGESGLYLTVLGTSAEGADSGQVGRGNKVNGVVALNRPTSSEAAAGKNPVSHVGKIYNLFSHRLANKIYEQVPGLKEVYIWLGSQIGARLDQPLMASAQVALVPGVTLESVQKSVQEILEQELAGIYEYSERLARGEFMAL